MATGDTICALATPAGQAARAVIRISGADLSHVFDAMLPDCARTRGIHRSQLRIRDNWHPMPLLAVVMPGPNSYTGEDVIELLVPGGVAITRAIMDRLVSLKHTRLAEPGEFTARAYLHDRLTLTQAEGVAAMISAQTQDELDRAHAMLRGDVGNRYERWAETVAHLLALVEAGIDFTDQEDVVAITPNELHTTLRTLMAEIHQHIGENTIKEAGAHEPLILIVGKPNAGKTTLFNALIGTSRNVVSEHAGTTRDVVIERVTLSDADHAVTIRLGDTAGIAEHSLDAIDAIGQSRARDAMHDAHVILHCDPAGQFLSLPEHSATSVIRVRTKSDLAEAPSDNQRHSALSICALTGESLDPLRTALLHAAIGASTSSAVPARHRVNLSQALSYLDETASMIDPTTDRLAVPESLAFPLRAALDSLGRITGRIDADDVLGRVFSAFCVGK
ncbi:MAG: 50S ribosome-binding GTPase [Phycisphaeraceae bacterium]|nr:50S ribosome-binding GTPase [Phycisphaerales bacterium]MCB9860150.1 50S ribosome-binding GTPase [Phycisphaeraceae bacterium]